MDSLTNITGLVVLCRCEELIPFSILPMREIYPEVNLIVVDNSCGDICTKQIEELAENDSGIQLIISKTNIGHGRGLLTGIKYVETPYVYIFDSDTGMIQRGLLEQMLEAIQPDKYGVGFSVWADKGGGTATPWNVKKPRPKGAIKYMHPFCSLISMKRYNEFEPADSSFRTGNTCWGAPFITMMNSLHDAGREDLLVDLPGLTYGGNIFVKHQKGGNRILVSHKGPGPVKEEEFELEKF